MVENQGDWKTLISGLGIGGLAAELSQHCDFIQYGDARLVLSLDPAHEALCVSCAQDQLQAALEVALGSPLRLEIRVPRKAA